MIVFAVGVKQQDVRYNLMAVVPDRSQTLSSRISTLCKNRRIIREALHRRGEYAIDEVQVKVEPGNEAEEAKKEESGSPGLSVTSCGTTVTLSSQVSGEQPATLGEQAAGMRVQVDQGEFDEAVHTNLLERPIGSRLRSRPPADAKQATRHSTRLDPPAPSPDDQRAAKPITLRDSNSLSREDLKVLLSRLEDQIRTSQSAYKEELDRRYSYKVDDGRRVHDYKPFITEFLKAVVQNDLLRGFVAERGKDASGKNLLRCRPGGRPAPLGKSRSTKAAVSATSKKLALAKRTPADANPATNQRRASERNSARSAQRQVPRARKRPASLRP